MKSFLKIILTLLLLILSSTLLRPIVAQEPTDSDEIPDEDIKQNVKERLEKISQQDGNSVLGTLDKKQAWVGNVQNISNDTLTIKTSIDIKHAEISDSANIINEKRQSIKLDNLELSSYVIAMGFLDSDQVLQTQRVVVTQEPEDNPVDSFLVTITDIQDDTLTVNNVHELQMSWELAITKNTSITQTVDGEQTEIDLDDLEIEDRLVIIGEPDSDAPTTLDTTSIHLVDGRTILADPDPEDTPSDESE